MKRATTSQSYPSVTKAIQANAGSRTTFVECRSINKEQICSQSRPHRDDELINLDCFVAQLALAPKKLMTTRDILGINIRLSSKKHILSIVTHYNLVSQIIDYTSFIASAEVVVRTLHVNHT